MKEKSRIHKMGGEGGVEAMEALCVERGRGRDLIFD